MIPLLIVLAVFILFTVFLYNSLVVKRNIVKNSFASVDTLLKKRYDLIPNLVNTVKTYMQHENKTLTKITELRSQAVKTDNPEKTMDIEKKMDGLLKSLMVQVENYPTLKANQNFLRLQTTLNTIEGQISAARRAYNAAVTDFNNSIRVFPNNIIAGMFNFREKKLFEITEEERKNVDVGKIFNE